MEWFRDQKFGFMVHWGPYSQWGVRESWLLSLDHPSRQQEIPNWDFDLENFRETYWALSRTFYPLFFEPEVWAQIAAEGGARYFTFTTKHHDGFSMYDTKLSEYRITSPECAYSDHPEPDVTKRLFDAFRARGLGIGVYYSKADWHSPFYWKPGVPAPNRNVNYNTSEEPERWQRFVDFVHGQIRELMTGYGPIDILWLDAGQVRPERGQDIDMDRLVAMARSHQPGLIVANRNGGALHEDYKTPEQRVPAGPMEEPWEACITMGDRWSFKPYDDYKSPRALVHLLVDVVSKGGNLILNVGPMPDGRIPPPAVERMKEIGAWLRTNGDAIYATRGFMPHRDGGVCYTRKGDQVNAIYLDDGTCKCGSASPCDCRVRSRLPASLRLKTGLPAPGTKVRLLGSDAAISWEETGGDLVVKIPEDLAKGAPGEYAYTFQVKVR